MNRHYRECYRVQYRESSKGVLMTSTKQRRIPSIFLWLGSFRAIALSQKVLPSAWVDIQAIKLSSWRKLRPLLSVGRSHRIKIPSPKIRRNNPAHAGRCHRLYVRRGGVTLCMWTTLIRQVQHVPTVYNELGIGGCSVLTASLLSAGTVVFPKYVAFVFECHMFLFLNVTCSFFLVLES